jgi:hypothetical protein
MHSDRDRAVQLCPRFRHFLGDTLASQHLNTLKYPQPTCPADCGPSIVPGGGPVGSSDLKEVDDVDSPLRQIERRLDELEAECRMMRGTARDIRKYVEQVRAGQAGQPPDADPSPRRGRPKSSARCAADIVLVIASAGHAMTVDQLAVALQNSYSRRTVAETAARMRAAGDLANGGNGYELPP